VDKEGKTGGDKNKGRIYATLEQAWRGCLGVYLQGEGQSAVERRVEKRVERRRGEEMEERWKRETSRTRLRHGRGSPQQ
jgi:hypothetical protein